MFLWKSRFRLLLIIGFFTALSTEGWAQTEEAAPPPPPPPPVVQAVPVTPAPEEAPEPQPPPDTETSSSETEGVEGQTAEQAQVVEETPPEAMTTIEAAPIEVAPLEEVQQDPATGAEAEAGELLPVTDVPAETTASATEVTPRSDQTDKMPEEEAAPRFFKGELIHVGTRKLLSRFDHVGVAGGITMLDYNVYATVTPGFAFYFDDWALSLNLPLNLLLFEVGALEYGGLKVRRQDWDEVPDFAKVIRFITIGRKEDNLYFTINSLRPISIGHGILVDNYQGNIDVDRSMTGIAFDAYNEYGGFEFQANDITFSNKLIGGLAFVKPFALLPEIDPIIQSISFGMEYVGDFNAPKCVILNNAGQPGCLQGVGHQRGFDPSTGENLDRSYVRSDEDNGRFKVEETTVHAGGLSAEIKVLKDERNVDIKFYTTMHKFFNQGGGSGWASGFLGRFNVGERWINAFRVRTEYRNFGDGFMPAYFDSMYEINKYSYINSSNPYQVAPTKYQSIFGDEKNQFSRPELGRKHGMNLEASYGLFKGYRSAKQVALGVGWQESNRPNDTQIYAHLEFPFLEFIQLFGTYMRINEDGIGNVFSGNLLEPDNAVVLTGVRLQILPVLFINAHYSRTYQIMQSPGTEYHLGNDTIPQVGTAYYPDTPEARLYENVETVFVEIELGLEFDEDDEEEEDDEDTAPSINAE